MQQDFEKGFWAWKADGWQAERCEAMWSADCIRWDLARRNFCELTFSYTGSTTKFFDYNREYKQLKEAT